jgi:hypothetical protein
VAGVTEAAAFEAVELIMVRGWDWARHWHCLGDASDVFALLHGVDPMASLRPRWRTMAGALRVVARAGGVDALVAPAFRAAGLLPGPAVSGAIGIGGVDSPAFGGRAVMICIAPGFWAGKTEAGFAVIRRDLDMGGWTCPH